MCLQSIIMKSKRILGVSGLEIIGVPRIHQGSWISIFRSLPSWEVLHLLCVSRTSSWSLRGHWRFLRGVLVVFEMLDTTRIHQGNYISISKSLPAWEVLHLLCVSRATSWSLRGSWRFLRGVLVVFDMVDASRIHQESYTSIFRSLPAWEVLHLLCVSRASSWSLRGRWRFLRGVLVVSTYWMHHGCTKEAAYEFLDLYWLGKYSISYVSPEHHHEV